MAWMKTFERNTSTSESATKTTTKVKKVTIGIDVKPGLMIFLGEVRLNLSGDKTEKEFEFKSFRDMTHYGDKYKKTLVMQSFELSDDGGDAKAVFHYHEGDDVYKLVFDSKDMKAPKDYKTKNLMRVEVKKI